MLFTFRTGRVTVRIVAEDSEREGFPVFAGPDAEVSRLRGYLTKASGPFGHGVVDGDGLVRPGDLAFALPSFDPSWELVDGEIIEYAQPPEGCVS